VRRVRQGLGIGMASMALTSCSLLVQFDTQPCDGGSCVDAGSDSVAGDVVLTDTTSSPGDAGGDTGAKESGPGPKDSGTTDDVDAMADADPCSGKVDGYQWGPLDIDRCCSQMSVTTDQTSNCGACGIVCVGAQHCGISPLSNGEYLCLECVLDTDCWSGHCVPDEVVSDGGATLDAGSHCAVESDDAGDCLGSCPPGTPPSGPPPCCPTGSRCAMPPGILLNYCTYNDAG
jgi:hypothetical protein